MSNIAIFKDDTIEIYTHILKQDTKELLEKETHKNLLSLTFGSEYGNNVEYKYLNIDIFRDDYEDEYDQLTYLKFYFHNDEILTDWDDPEIDESLTLTIRLDDIQYNISDRAIKVLKERIEKRIPVKINFV